MPWGKGENQGTYQELTQVGKTHKRTCHHGRRGKMMVFATCCVDTGFPQARRMFLGRGKQAGVLEGLGIRAIPAPVPSAEPGTQQILNEPRLSGQMRRKAACRSQSKSQPCPSPAVLPRACRMNSLSLRFLRSDAGVTGLSPGLVVQI